MKFARFFAVLLMVFAFAASTAVFTTGCKDDSPADKTKDAVEDAGDAAEDAANDIGDAINDATD